MTRRRRNTRAWTTAELEQLRRLAHLGAAEAARALGRSVVSVRSAASRYRISLRRPGQRSGLVLGQPRGVASSDLAAYRAAVLAGLDPAEVQARGIAALLGRSLCPACGRRPQEVRSSGFCKPCHLEALAEGVAHVRAEHRARRLWDAERQRRHRGSRGAPEIE